MAPSTAGWPTDQRRVVGRCACGPTPPAPAPRFGRRPQRYVLRRSRRSSSIGMAPVVPDRHVDAARAGERIEALSAAGVQAFVVSGTHVGNVDGQLGARPVGRGRPLLCCDERARTHPFRDPGPVRAPQDHSGDRRGARAARLLRADRSRSSAGRGRPTEVWWTRPGSC